MSGEVVLRFLLGGLAVSTFSALGELFAPKSFSGLFGAAPSVALASLTMTFAVDGPSTVLALARWMIAGAIATIAYASSCVALGARRHFPMWLAATGSWLVWLAVAVAAWVAHGVVAHGVLR